MSEWRIEYDNECTPDGDGGSYFGEWWTVTDGRRSFRCEYEDDAEMLLKALQAADTIARLEAERDAARREALEEAARMLDAEHERSKHMHNYAAVYARAIREAMEKC